MINIFYKWSWIYLIVGQNLCLFSMGWASIPCKRTNRFSLVQLVDPFLELRTAMNSTVEYILFPTGLVIIKASLQIITVPTGVCSYRWSESGILLIFKKIQIKTKQLKNIPSSVESSPLYRKSMSILLSSLFSAENVSSLYILIFQ